jgi:hypothetical protein
VEFYQKNGFDFSINYCNKFVENGLRDDSHVEELGKVLVDPMNRIGAYLTEETASKVLAALLKKQQHDLAFDLVKSLESRGLSFVVTKEQVSGLLEELKKLTDQKPEKLEEVANFMSNHWK